MGQAVVVIVYSFADNLVSKYLVLNGQKEAVHQGCPHKKKKKELQGDVKSQCTIQSYLPTINDQKVLYCVKKFNQYSWLHLFLKWQPCPFPVMAFCFAGIIFPNVFKCFCQLFHPLFQFIYNNRMFVIPTLYYEQQYDTSKEEEEKKGNYQ